MLQEVNKFSGQGGMGAEFGDLYLIIPPAQKPDNEGIINGRIGTGIVHVTGRANKKVGQVNAGKHDETVIATLNEVIDGFAKKVKAEQAAQHFKRKQYISDDQAVPVLHH